MAELAEGFGLDLPDALPRHIEESANLLQRASTAVAQTITIVKNLTLAASQRFKHFDEPLVHKTTIRCLAGIHT